MDVIDWLDERRRELGFNNEQFARWLGISQAAWSHYINRRRGVGVHLLRRARAKFPEHRGLICDLALGIPTEPGDTSSNAA